jgi:SAM-dependent methyltransferase
MTSAADGVAHEAAHAGLASLLANRDLEINAIRSSSELAAIRAGIGDRLAVERLLSETAAERESWTLPGVCQVCERAVAFEGDWRHSGGGKVNFRERLVCPNCGLNNRKRFMAYAVRTAESGRPEDAPTYLFEAVTPFFAWARQALPSEVIGSEYLGPGIASGTVVDDVRHEDALALSFEDETLGAIVSCDVFEHVPDIDRCLAECARALRPGGRLYFSIPFYDTPDTRQRATIREGELVELLPPQHHWNPVDPTGSLVFYDYGWDILDRCRSAGFADAHALGYWSLLYGYLGDGLQLSFAAEKPR